MIKNLSGPIDLTNKVALVTGAARGVGCAIAKALARECSNVAVADIIPCANTVSSIQKYTSEVLDIHCNVLEKDAINRCVHKVIDRWGRIDILVNNAGILGDSTKELEEYGEEEWDHVININLKGYFLMTQAVWPYMKKHGGGKIVCISSLAARIGGVLAGPHYCASKGGVHAFVKWAAKNGMKYGIYVNGVAPGPVDSPMTINEPYKDEMVPIGRLGQPQDIAEAVIFLVSQASNHITGNCLDVNGGALMV